VLQDTADGGRFIETFLVESWMEHLRQHRRATNADRILERLVHQFVAEIFPLYVRGRGMGAATIANWGFNLLVTVTFLEPIATLGRPGTFFLYAGLAIAAYVFTRTLVRETKGRSLEQIEAELRLQTQSQA
jgi:hypothetical protein